MCGATCALPTGSDWLTLGVGNNLARFVPDGIRLSLCWTMFLASLPVVTGLQPIARTLEVHPGVTSGEGLWRELPRRISSPGILVRDPECNLRLCRAAEDFQGSAEAILTAVGECHCAVSDSA